MPKLPRGCFSGGDIYSYRWLYEMLPNSGCTVELGTFYGRSICSVAAQILRKKINVTCVDMFIKLVTHFSASQKLLEKTFEQRPEGQEVHEGLLQSLQRYGLSERVKVIVLDSAKAASRFEDATVDLVFVDACHEYSQVLADLVAWWPKLKDTGIMSGHDYTKRGAFNLEGVTRACHEFFNGPSLIRKNEVQRQTLVWHVRKPEMLAGKRL